MMRFGCVLNQVQSAYDLNSSLPQYLWVGATESCDQSLSGMLMSVLAGKLNCLLVSLKWVRLSPDTLDMSSNTSQVLGIPCFGKSIDFQWDLFRQSFASVGNSISWQFLWVFRSIYLYRCRKLLVLANPLTFNGICFDKAFPIRNSFISLFFTVAFFFCRLLHFFR